MAIQYENDHIIKANLEEYKKIYGEDTPVKFHPKIRSEGACYDASSRAIAMAKKMVPASMSYTSAQQKELELFDNSIPLKQKLVTSEACINHMCFSEVDLATKGNLIKWNPSIKTAKDRKKIFQKMIHNVAILFRIENRGSSREGCFPDLVLVDLVASWTVSQDDILAKCSWSPFKGHTFRSQATHMIVSGH